MDIEKIKKISKEYARIEMCNYMIEKLEEAWEHTVKSAGQVTISAPNYCLNLPQTETCEIITLLEEYFRGQIEVSETYLDGLE